MNKYLCVLILILSITGIQQASADWLDEDNYVFYIGPLVEYSSISGDFTGQTVQSFKNSTGGLALVVLPAIQSNFAYGFIGGVRNGRATLELIFSSASFLATRTAGFPGSTTASLSQIGFEAKYFVIDNPYFKPFILAGVSFPWMIVSPYFNAIGSSYVYGMTLNGISLSAGAGLTLEVSFISITAGVNLRSVQFFNVIITDASGNTFTSSTSTPFVSTGATFIPYVNISAVF